MNQLLGFNDISVVIPTHNRPDGLTASVKSVFNQTLLPKELIVVDDGSEPPVTKEIFNGCPDGLIAKLFRNESPKGANNARNRGIKEASGEWVAFLDDDDEFFKEKIEVVSKVIAEKGDAIDLVYHPAHIFMVNEGVSYLSRPTCFSPHDDVFRRLLTKNHIGGTSMVITRKSSLLSASMFDEQLPALQDYDLWLRMARMPVRFYLVSKALTKYHHVSKSISTTKSLESVNNARKIIDKKFEEEYLKLTIKEKQSLAASRSKANIFIAHLKKNQKLATKTSFKSLLKHRSLLFLWLFLTSLPGSGFFIAINAKAKILFKN
jgi:glycosyltransferase involved in cell wall biosynthesis